MTVSISVFFTIFLVFCLKKIDLFSLISFYPVKLQQGKEADAIVSKVTCNACLLGHYFRFIDTFPEKTDTLTMVFETI